MVGYGFPSYGYTFCLLVQVWWFCSRLVDMWWAYNSWHYMYLICISTFLFYFCIFRNYLIQNCISVVSSSIQSYSLVQMIGCGFLSYGNIFYLLVWVWWFCSRLVAMWWAYNYWHYMYLTCISTCTSLWYWNRL